MDKLLPCPFCGGTAKLSAKDHLWIGFKGDGRGVREYLIRAICNKCKARGPVIATGPVNTMYYCYKRKENHVTKEDVDALSSAESKAIAAWNRRAQPEIICPLLSDAEVKQPCIEGPCPATLLTNADRIRGMSDDELAREMLFFMSAYRPANTHYTGLAGAYYKTAEETIQSNLDWLKAETEGKE